MKRLIPLVLAALWAGCAAPKPKPAAVAASNFEFNSYEVVGTPEEDTLEYVQVFVDGQPQGRTETAAKSRTKLWLGQIAEGNHPMRFEVWDSSDGVSGARRPDELQPGERFFRIEPGQKTRVTLKFTDAGRQSLLYVTREPK